MSQPLIIAHRGDTREFTENTMEAFGSAFQNGADGIELDIHELSGKLVVVHNYTFDQSKNYPELKEVLSNFADKGRIEIEIKSIGLEFIEPLKESLSDYQDCDIELTTSVAGIVSYIRSEFPDKKLGVIMPKNEFEPWMAQEGFLVPKIVKSALLYKADIMHINPDFISEELIAELHASDILVHSHIHKKPIEEEVAIYSRLAILGIDQVTVDDLSLIATLQTNGLRMKNEAV